MNAEFFEALKLLEAEKGISVEYLCEKIENAIVIAVRKDYAGIEDVKAIIDPETQTFEVALRKTVAEEVEDPANQISIDQAVKYNKKAQVGDVIDIPLETKQFGRIAAQTAKHVIKQGIREAERGQVLKEFQSIKIIQYAFNGIRAGVLALIIKALWSMYIQCPKNVISYIIIACSFILTALLNVNVLIVIISCAILGLVTSIVISRRKC